MIRVAPRVAACLCLLATPAPAIAEGYLAGKAEKLETIEIGLGETGLEKKGGDYNLETGKGYQLKFKSTGAKECAFQAPDFFANIYLRKIEVGKVEIKVPGLREIEMEEAGEADIFFVPIKPGEYKWACKGLEEKGVAGKFTIK